MKILLVGDYASDPRLGSPKVFYKLREEYRNLGHRCDVLLEDDLLGVPRNRRLRYALAPLAASAAIDRYLCRCGPVDIVDVASAEGWIFGLKRRWSNRRKSIGLISRSNGLEHLNFSRMIDDHRCGLIQMRRRTRIWQPMARHSQVALSARFSDKLIVLNEKDREFAVMQGWKDETDIHIIHHGVSDCFLREQSIETQRGSGLLFCGSWTETKGISYLVRAFEKLVADGYRVNLTILGGGVPEAVIRTRFSSDAQKQLTVLPRVGEEEVMVQYRMHDALILPSTYEGFGMVVIEAMSQRLPVIATSVGCAPTLIKDGETGMLVRPRDHVQLAAAAVALLSDTTLRARIAENALAAVRQMSWRHTAIRTLSVYEEVMRRRQVA